MEKTIYNLVLNSLSYSDLSKPFVNALIKGMSNEYIIELAKKEIKVIQYFIIIEDPEWGYWRKKEKKLYEVINKLSK